MIILCVLLQNGTETVRAEVKEVINGTRKETLKQPLRIILRKSEVEVRYNIFYQGVRRNCTAWQCAGVSSTVFRDSYTLTMTMTYRIRHGCQGSIVDSGPRAAQGRRPRAARGPESTIPALTSMSDCISHCHPRRTAQAKATTLSSGERARASAPAAC